MGQLDRIYDDEQGRETPLSPDEVIELADSRRVIYECLGQIEANGERLYDELAKIKQRKLFRGSWMDFLGEMFGNSYWKAYRALRLVQVTRTVVLFLRARKIDEEVKLSQRQAAELAKLPEVLQGYGYQIARTGSIEEARALLDAIPDGSLTEDQLRTLQAISDALAAGPGGKTEAGHRTHNPADDRLLKMLLAAAVLAARPKTQALVAENGRAGELVDRVVPVLDQLASVDAAAVERRALAWLEQRYRERSPVLADQLLALEQEAHGHGG